MLGCSSRRVGDDRRLICLSALALPYPRKSPKIKITNAMISTMRKRHVSIFFTRFDHFFSTKILIHKNCPIALIAHTQYKRKKAKATKFSIQKHAHGTQIIKSNQLFLRGSTRAKQIYRTFFDQPCEKKNNNKMVLVGAANTYSLTCYICTTKDYINAVYRHTHVHTERCTNEK